ncbi:MAG: hypothetical protein UV61_C0016G0007 [Candidatus Gottesmanbacteria bacterium GW2011_GWB1_43_11]|uniref:Uncharacterized protein n=1 Tax=Candidatus Gottesmanbacteria bacterium GW2011_GWB1_43_11 TaxID=1618446 RepID=A0A0G1CIL7_9BACT|nr:MAG: hypothetical protein UV04_C0006G0045 [Candidatus Gottesmanbacteria bacterium GW2011_GWA2_42_16]KKS52999.1 MAG: hypothetical protein UV17_C0041G0008 [Candidatus Gottesmanbacteria bacterium GW2011_GWA1_42_26]KKS80840.1 MAG: hypothetical protein UV55_C0028G0013 [Candidatus Gottesmanbacteria bacterium GW2011_GWC1_43_10]KKS85635.1 MAG: hypothetical protein UV61_C0016G0007 [Candidatus Gottesmanbacteria bacterium GW2011_GWB1_43_11]OGG10649.1 MAG: hypothetical protein A2699_00280 [Candidatus Go
MNKKLLIGGSLLVVLAVAAGVFIWLGKSKTPTSSSSKSSDLGIKPIENMITWSDPAGFTFNYPDTLKVDKHDEDQENYAHVELTDAAHPGKIIIWAKDLPLTKSQVAVANVDEWVSADKQLASSNVLDTELGGQTAKKILVGQNQLVLGAIYDGLLFTVEGELTDNAYWSKVYDQITSSFAFDPTADNSSATGDSGATDVSVDEEEVVE